ncbi:MAG TPA: class I SAM-dependent methyltransferase, partial [Vicinamibacterales bacterium]
MPKTVYDPSDCDQFGNLDANLRFLERTGAIEGPGRILEIGSGRGDLLAEFQRRRLRAAGIEPSAELARDARAKHGPLPLARMAGERLGFVGGAFRLVVSFDVFEHIRASDTHLDDVARVLEPGGVYAFQTPNKWTNTVFETVRWRSFTAWR